MAQQLSETLKPGLSYWLAYDESLEPHMFRVIKYMTTFDGPSPRVGHPPGTHSPLHLLNDEVPRPERPLVLAYPPSPESPHFDSQSLPADRFDQLLA